MSYDGTLSFGTVLDLKGLKEGMKKLEGFLKQNQGFFTSVTDSMDATQLLEQKLTALTGSSEAAQAAMAALGASLEDTGYNLGTAAAAMDALVTHGMGLETATATMAAWGDAVAAYAGGSNTALASVSNTLADLQAAGSVSMSHVNALLDAGVPVVETYAAAVGTSVEEARTALSSGEVSAGSFFAVMNGAIEQGAAGLPALAGAASAANLTWSGAFTSMRDSVGRGVAAILTSIDEANTSVGRPELKQGVENLGKAFETVLTATADAIGPIVQNLDSLIPVVLGIVTSFKAAKFIPAFWKEVETATELVLTAKGKEGEVTREVTLATKEEIAAAAKLATNKDKNTAAIQEKTAAQTAETAAAQAGNAAQAVSTTMTEGEVATQLASTGAISLKTLALGGLRGGLDLATISTIMMDGAAKVLNKTLNAMGGGFGLVLTLLPMVAGLVYDVVQSINKGSPAFQEQKEAVEEAASAYEDFSTSVADAKKSYDNAQSSFQAQKQNAKELTDTLTTLSGKENKSAADKAALAETVALLNNQFDGLNLTIDEQTGALSQSAEEVAAYVQAQQQISNSEAVLQRHNELLQEQQEAERQLQELQAQRQEIETQFNEGAFGDGKRKELLESLAESEAGYLQQKQEITAELDALNAGQAASEAAAAQAAIDAAEAAAAAEEAAAQRRADSISSFTDSATNMFQSLKDQNSISVGEMIKNLNESADAEEAYQANLQKVREDFANSELDTSVLDYFTSMGTEGMAAIAQLANAQEGELEKLVDAYARAGKEGAESGAAAVEENAGLYKEAGQEAANQSTEGYIENATTLPDAATTSITETKEATDAAVENAGFDDDGKKIQTITADGVEENADELSEAVTDSIKSAHTAAADAVEHTPFASIGEAIVSAIAAGVGANWSILNDAVTTLIENCAIAGGGKRVYGKSDQKNPASKPRAVGVEWAPHPWVAMGLVSEELMNAKIPNAAEVVAQMQAGVAMNQARVAAEGAPRAMHRIYTAQLAAAPATSTAKEGGMKVGAINVAIDAKNVKEFNDVVKIAQRAVMSYRQGYVDH